MKNHRKDRVIISYFIIFCLILIQFTPMAAIVQAEELGDSGQTDVQTIMRIQPFDLLRRKILPINNGTNPPSDEANSTNNEGTTPDENNTTGLSRHLQQPKRLKKTLIRTHTF